MHSIYRKLRFFIVFFLACFLCACIHVTKVDNSKFTPTPDFQAQIHWGSQPGPPFDHIPPEKYPCEDKDKAVVATCVQVTGSIVPINDNVLFVGERNTGDIVEFSNKKRVKNIAHVPVDTRNSGGLLDYTLSPDYTSNKIIYALITTPTDIRLVRIAQGNDIKPILTGLPLNNPSMPPSGALLFRGQRLYILLGSSNNAENDHLKGTLFYLTDLSTNTPQSPQIVYSGLKGRVDMCPTYDEKNMYIVNHQTTVDKIFTVSLDTPYQSSTLWTWNQPVGIASCISTNKKILIISENENKSIVSLHLGQDGLVNDQPQTIISQKYGRINRLSGDGNGMLYFGTVNYNSPERKINDDKVVRFKVSASSGGSSRA